MADTSRATTIEQKTDHRETSDVYRGEVFRRGRYRVAACRDGLQWPFQRQRFEFTAGGAAWDTLGYCVTRKALIGLHQAYKAPQHERLQNLPKRFKREVVWWETRKPSRRPWVGARLAGLALLVVQPMTTAHPA